MKCARCECDMPAGEKVCSICGFENKSSGKKAAIIAIVSSSVAFVVLAIIIAVAVTINMNSSKNAAEAFSENVAEFEKLQEEYCVGVYEDEYDELLGSAEECMEKKEYTEFDKQQDAMKKLSGKIIEANKKVKEYQELYQSLGDRYAAYIVEGDDSVKLESLKTELMDAISDVDENECKRIKSDIERYDQEIVTGNEAVLKDCDAQITAADKSVLYSPEMDELNAQLTNARTLQSQGQYAAAKQAYDECSNMLTLAANALQYDMSLKQVDVSAFPDIKLYLSIQNLTTGETLDGLNESSFSLYEKIRGNATYEQSTLSKAVQMDKNEGLNTAVVADVSASMGDDLYVAEDAMCDFVGNLQYEVNDRAALYSFADTVYREQHFTGNESRLYEAINNLQMGNMTALYDALVYAVSDVVVEDGAKCVIAFTDGMENNSNSSKSYVIEKAKQYDIPIYIIGIGSSVDSYELTDIAESTGGFYRNISYIDSMADVYNEIYARQKALYVLQYTTAMKNKEKLLRNIYIRYSDDNYTIRTEDSYTPSDYKIDKFVFYDSDKRYLDESELKKLSEEEVLIALNEIYARRGYKFSTNPFLIDHFNSCTWYKGKIKDMGKVEKKFNKYEKKNVSLLVKYEKENQLNNRK